MVAHLDRPQARPRGTPGQKLVATIGLVALLTFAVFAVGIFFAAFLAVAGPAVALAERRGWWPIPEQ